MKTGIIYASKSGNTEKIAKALAQKIKGEVKLIPISKAKSACLLKYDFIIIAGSIHYGRIQGEIKSFVNKNSKTLLGLNYGLFISCAMRENEHDYLIKSFGEEIVKSALISSSFGGELDSNQGNFVTKRMIRSIEKQYSPSIDWELVDDFANTVNERMKKQ